MAPVLTLAALVLTACHGQVGEAPGGGEPGAGVELSKQGLVEVWSDGLESSDANWSGWSCNGSSRIGHTGSNALQCDRDFAATSTSIDVSGHANLAVSVWVYTDDYESSDCWEVAYSCDGGASFTTLSRGCDDTNAWEQHSGALPSSCDGISDLRLRFDSNASSYYDDVYADDWVVMGDLADSASCDCTGKACGDDGCGGSCGTCADGEVCTSAQQCEPESAPAPEPAPSPEGHCMEGIGDYSNSGPFDYRSTSSGYVNMWVPDVPDGCKVPVVHLANGTGASCSTYGAILRHLASHGFLATCYEDTNTGQGTQCVTALETAMARYPDLADNKIGSTGHSQGGGGAIMCVARAEAQWGDSMRYAGHAMEPAHGYGDSPSNWGDYYARVTSPIFMFNGSEDSLVSASWVERGFNALDGGVEAYWYEAQGAAHIPVPTRWTEESAVAWFRWKLLDDNQACSYFKNMPDTRDWRLMDMQNETGC